MAADATATTQIKLASRCSPAVEGGDMVAANADWFTPWPTGQAIEKIGPVGHGLNENQHPASVVGSEMQKNQQSGTVELLEDQRIKVSLTHDEP